MDRVIKHLRYLNYVLRHKWFVFIECLKYGLVWRGIKHDWTKFLPSEWFAYVNYFYGEKVAHPTEQVMNLEKKFVPRMVVPPQVQEAFDRAWNYHQKRHSHHWQFWLLSPDVPRPNFWDQSHDGGMSEAVIADKKGNAVAILYHDSVDWWKPSEKLQSALVRDLRNTPVPLDMPMADRKEMLADWRGAGRAAGKSNTWEWYQLQKAQNRIFLHPNTQNWIEGELEEQRRQQISYEKARGTGII